MIPSVECVNLDLHDRAEKAEAEVARLKELQPCGHPTSAIRSTPYIGNQHSNYCGWCADVEHEHELCQTLTAELLEYRGRVARLTEALKSSTSSWYCEAPGCSVDNPLCDAMYVQAVLSTPATDWLAQHDAEVRQEERERCEWLALEHDAPEWIDAARAIAAAIREAPTT